MTLILTLIISLISVSLIFKNETLEKRNEQLERLKLILPIASKSISGNLLVDDKESIPFLLQELKLQYQLSDIMISDNDLECAHEIRKNIVCISNKLEYIAPTKYIILKKDTEITEIDFYIMISMSFIPVIVTGLLFSYVTWRQLNRSIVEPLTSLVNHPQQSHGHLNNGKVAKEILELHESMVRFIEYKQKKQKADYDLRIKVEQTESLIQIAHDIRSPLAALDLLVQSTEYLPENLKLLIRHSVNRIRDIANHMLSKSRIMSSEKQNFITHSHKLKQKNLVWNLIDLIVTEKRISNTNKLIEIEQYIADNCRLVYSEINGIEFTRLMSNILDNSIESIVATGKIIVSQKIFENKIEINVRDNGCGIPKKILKRLGEKGVTHGKAHGTGLGLHHAITTIKKWNGELKIHSAEDIGTEIKISLPISSPPRWISNKLEYRDHSIILILDDDTSIHNVWNTRLSSAEINCRHLNFYSISTLDKWIQENESFHDSIILLADYEIYGSNENGLAYLAKISNKIQKILVTSHFDEEKIIGECIEKNIKLIPKTTVPFIEISHLDTDLHYHAILIDDDKLVHDTWKCYADMTDKIIATFFSVDEFLSSNQIFDKSTKVYIDSQLGNGERGEYRINDIKECGYNEIFLCTGYSHESLGDVSGFKAIVDKKPPW